MPKRKISTPMDSDDEEADSVPTPKIEQMSDFEHPLGVIPSKRTEMKSKMERLTKETILLKKEINDLKETVSNVVKQNLVIMNLINEQQVMITGIFKCEPKPNSTYADRFPIQSSEEMDALEALITDDNRDKLVFTIQALLTPGGMIKNLSSVFSIQVCLDHNMDGIKKKRLLNYPKILDLLFRATLKDGWSQKTFQDEIRRSLKQVKNRHFKNVCENRRKEREKQLKDSLPVEEEIIMYDGDEEEEEQMVEEQFYPKEEVFADK